MKRIGIDVDQVLADFSAMFDKFHDERYGTDFCENPQTEFFLINILDITREEELRRVKEFYDSEYFVAIEPMTGAVEAVRELAKDYELFVITSRPDFVREATEAWVDRFFPGYIKEVFLTNNYFGGTEKKKSDICLEINADYMVEDLTTHANDCAEVGVSTFLINKPWNVNEELASGVIRVNSWEDILRLLNKNK